MPAERLGFSDGLKAPGVALLSDVAMPAERLGFSDGGAAWVTAKSLVR